MDIKTNRSALLLIRQMADHKTSTIPRIVTAPQKPRCSTDTPIAQPFPRTSPEAQGISASRIAAFLEDIYHDETLDPHGIMILRNGAVIAETGFGAYDQRLWHITHSECKSITGLAIGMLIDEGKLSLDDKVAGLFDNLAAKLAQLMQKNMTVRHLLNMTSGVVFNETGAVTETDWVRCFLESVVFPEPGKKFAYNSMNTYMLSAIVRQVSGQGLMEFLQDRLWKPLGITDVFWESCPQGIEKGGWGLYIRPEDIAKVGQLFLQQGRWGDQQLISEHWIQEATTAQMATPENLGNYDYGYQLWVGKTRPAFLFNGMFGQNVLGFPDTGILIVSNAGNNELFQQSSFYQLVDRYFPADIRPPDSLPRSRKTGRQLHTVLQSLLRVDRNKNRGWYAELVNNEQQINYSRLCTALDGHTYLTDTDASAAVGLLPLFVQVIQNNYTRGLKSLRFEFTNDVFYLEVAETDEAYRLPVGFGDAARTELSFHGEPHQVAVNGRFTTDEDNTLVLVLRISFLEIANARLLKIFFHNGAIVTKWSESPGKAYLTNALNMLKSDTKVFPFVTALIAKADSDYVHYKVNCILEPEITALPAANDSALPAGQDNSSTILDQSVK